MKILCSQCGAGKVELEDVHPELYEALVALKRKPGMKPAQILSHKVNETAMNQRLYRLMNLNLVRRERDGKAFRYYPI